jgi:hypothetical protein
MSKLMDQSGNTRLPPLRVVYADEETDQIVAQDVDVDKDDDGAALAEAQTEAYWAGRRPATRHSARLSA